MTKSIARVTVVGAALAAAFTVSTGSAVADPACGDAVAGALHAVHDTTGDPTGLVHEAEEIYCSVG
jgi:hypothetical protein